MATTIALGATLVAGVAWPGAVSATATASTSAPGERCAPVAGVTATALGTLGGWSTVAVDLDDRGVVVGVSDTDIPGPTSISHAFRWEDGVMTDLTPTADYGVATDINDRGEILVRENDESGERMFIWSRRGTTPIPGAVAIDDRGGALLANAVWRRGTVTDILSPDPGHWINASGIGSRGHVFGYVIPFPGPGGGHPPHDGAFVWRDGTMTVVRVPGLYMPTPVGVDRTGRLLVEAVTADGGTRAVLSDGDDHVVLPSLTGSPEASTTAADINDRGDAVGSSVTASGAQHAVLWTDGRVIDLHTLGTSSVARSIGANGHVAGTYVADDGSTRAFLWWCGRMTDLGPTGGGPIIANARGQVLVGTTLYTPTR